MSYALLNLLSNALGVYIFIMVLYIISSWLLAFGVINTRNPIAAQIIGLLRTLTEPVLGPIRKVVPPIGGLDLSPIIVFFGIYFIQDLLRAAAMKALIA